VARRSCDVRFESPGCPPRNHGSVVKATRKGEFDRPSLELRECGHVVIRENWEAAIKAVEAVDAGLGHNFQTLKFAGKARGYHLRTMECRTMIDPATGRAAYVSPTNPVPFILVSHDERAFAASGSLRDMRRRC